MSEVTEPKRRAVAFLRMREAHRNEAAEDYVELVGDLIAATGEARLTDLAAHLGVSAATASKVVQRLQLAGLLEIRPYRSILLTERGQAVAAASRHRHAIVREFLRAIGVSDSTSEADAEGMEHHVSDETLAALARTTRELKPK